MSEPSNRICPRCGKGGYIHYIDHSNMYEAKCYNCGFYFAFGELNLYLNLYEEKKPVTNADRIRAMTDEKLAEFLDGVKSDWWDGIVPVTVIDSKNMFDSNDILEWLKEESKDD